MPNPADLTASAVDVPSPEMHEAEVLDNASTESDEVRCVIPSFGGEFATDPLAWVPHVKSVGVFFPKKGNRAIVSYHKDGPPAIVSWWPEESAEPDHAF